MHLICPKCGSARIIYAGTSTGTPYGSTDQRYYCKDCGYRGSLIIDVDEREGGGQGKREKTHRTSLLLLIFMLSVTALAFGEEMEDVAVFFISLTLMVLLLTKLTSYESIPVEDDLRNLDEHGHPRYPRNPEQY